MKSRPIQYLGLLLLILASLAVIYLPFGSRPGPQKFTMTVSVPKPFSELVAKGKSPSDEADAAFVKEFTASETLPEAFTPSSDGKTATIQDQATTQADAKVRADRIVKALATKFKGVKLTSDSSADLPVSPLFAIGPNTAVYPPLKREGKIVPAVKLGLDLQGGVNLVLQVRRALFTYTVANPPSTPSARNELLQKVTDAIVKTDEGVGLRGADVAFSLDVPNQIEVRTQAKDKAQFDVQTAAIESAIKTLSGVKLTPTGKPQFYMPESSVSEQFGATGDYTKQLLDRTVEIIRTRVDGLGVSEPLIQSQAPDRVIVQLPGISDPQKAVDQIGKTAQMEIRLLPEGLQPVPDRNDPNNTLFATAQGQPVDTTIVREQSELIVSGIDVKPNTTAGLVGAGEPAIFFELQGDGAKRFAEVTRRVAKQGRFIPIFLDNRCISAPTVNEPITGGRGQISGGFADVKEARELAVLLNSGALPAPIDVVENRTVSATLGNDSLVKSLQAGLIGVALVMVFMVVFYRVPGIVATFALIIYTLLNLAAFVLVGGTLTLPGIAGFLLAMAMSLDTNVLVFERLKEEMAIQPTFTAALRAAFNRAWTAILDSHVTTLVAAVVLFYFGTGPVKGFALTLGIGVILSLFSAISVTRLFMWSIVKLGEKNPKLFAGKLPTKETVLANRS
jgi:protein-export membrane protein SecD